MGAVLPGACGVKSDVGADQLARPGRLTRHESTRRKRKDGDAMAEVSGSRQVVIVGGGFAGLFAARMLARAPVRVTLIDRAEHHLFQPLLYQCATGILSEGKISAFLL